MPDLFLSGLLKEEKCFSSLPWFFHETVHNNLCLDIGV